jgi:hypothetical protein
VTVEYITEAPGNPFPLGRSIVNHDPRNRGFAALQQPGLTAQAKPGSVWFTRDVYDQIGSSCTANAAVGVLRTGPFRNLPGVKAAWPQYDSEQERFDLYRVAQRNDPWEGEEPDYEGTSTDAPFRVLRDRGVIPGWRWLLGDPVRPGGDRGQLLLGDVLPGRAGDHEHRRVPGGRTCHAGRSVPSTVEAVPDRADVRASMG